ncbi:unnamed protein product [Paramecium sonneborni]|uniref:Transmembrane protein n=1 Tax=Paramecium sonneborni TaxID=65129 RepID=A0A8S1QSQ5_9CILI|nr:unnamed protein product [Paramecium sonneborni]
MLLDNVIDLTDKVISLMKYFADDSRLDINLIIGIICRFIIQTCLILFWDLFQFTTGQIVIWIFVWLIQHIHIWCFERCYFREGGCNFFSRDILYKIMDSLQLLLGIIFFAINLNYDKDIILLTLFSIIFLWDLYLIIQKFKTKEVCIKDYKKEGGIYQCYIGFLLGAVGIIIFFVYLNMKLQDIIIDGVTIINYSIIFIVGQIILVVESIILVYQNRYVLSWSKDWAKGILGFLYGVHVGIFSIFYGFLIGLYLFIRFFWKHCLNQPCDDKEDLNTFKQSCVNGLKKKNQRDEIAQIENKIPEIEENAQIVQQKQESEGNDQL